MMLEQPDQQLMEQFGVEAISQFTQVNSERLARVAQWVDENNIRVNVDKLFPIEDAAKAPYCLENIHPSGKWFWRTS